MKQLVKLALISLFTIGMAQAHQSSEPHEHNGLLGTAHAAETKKVCVKEKDPKTKKEKEVCKTIKVHKKLDVKDQKK
jgi:hypothetical protein